MNDIDDVLRRTYAEPPEAPGARPSPERLAAALRAGHRRRARRQAAAGMGAAALTVGLLLGVVALRNDTGDEGIPADTTSAVTTATTVSGAPKPAPTVTGTSVAGPVAATPGLPQFVAVSTTGRVEVWARTGLVRTVQACGLAASGEPCEVDGAAVSSDAVWFVERRATSAHLFWAPLGFDVEPTERPLPPDADVTTLAAVSADGEDVYVLTRQGPLLRLRDGDVERVGGVVTAASLSGDGRLAYTDGNAVVVRPVAGGEERRIEPTTDGIAGGPIQWSPDSSRLLLTWSLGESGSVVVVDLAPSWTVSSVSSTPFVPACWSGATTVAVGAWVPSPGDDTRGPIALVDAVDGSQVGTIDGSFGEAIDGVCRGDGAVVLVQHAGPDWSDRRGDLVMVGRDGRSTRLGIDYATVLPLGSGPVVLLDPATLPAPTTTTAPRLATTAADAFAALTADGKLEVWAPSGKVLTIDVGTSACLDFATCGPPDRVDAVALTERSIWYGGSDGVLWRAALDGTSAPTKVSTGEGAIQGIAVSADDSVVWFVRSALDSQSGRTAATLVRRERGVETTVAEDAASVSLSPDGRKLAFSTYAFTGEQGGPTEGNVIGELVVRDLVTGAEIRQPWRVREGFPGALVDLRWSPDGTRLLVAASWEGQRDFLLPADLSTGLDAPAYLGTGELEARSCWIDATTIARGLWSIVYAEGPSRPSNVVSGDLRTGQQTPYGVSVYGDTLACRSDGSVALVDKGAAYEQPGELVVVRPGGRRTVLGRGYRSVFPG